MSAGAQADHAIRQAQQLQDVLGVVDHGLQLVVAFLGLGVLDHLHLVELVHTDEAARVATGAAGLLAEARGERAVVKRQVRGLEHLARVDVGQLHLGRGDQIEALTGF